jgi:hypothetical protein
MKTRTVIASSIIILMSACGTAFADDINATVAEKLVVSLGMEKSLDAAIEQRVDTQIKQKMEMSPYKEVMTKFYGKYMSYNSLKPELTKMVSQTFSKKEMEDIAAFYDTPTGKKMIAKMPEIVSKAAKSGADRAEANLDDMVVMIRSSHIKSHGGM